MSAEEDSSSVRQETPQELATKNQESDDDCDSIDDEELEAALKKNLSMEHCNEEMAAVESIKAEMSEEPEEPEDTDEKKEEDIEVKTDAKEKEEDAEDFPKEEEDFDEVKALEALPVDSTISGMDAESPEPDSYRQEDAVHDQATAEQLTAEEIIADLDSVVQNAMEAQQREEHVQEDEEASELFPPSPMSGSRVSTSARSRPDLSDRWPRRTAVRQMAADRSKEAEGLLPESARPRCQVHRAVSAAAAAAADSAAAPSRQLDPCLQSNRVHIQRTAGAKLGVKVMPVLDAKSLMVREVEDDGLIQAWNIANPQQAVRAGDLIVAVNKKEMSTRQLIDALKSTEADSQNVLITCSIAANGAEAQSAGREDASSAMVRRGRLNGLRGSIPCSPQVKSTPSSGSRRPPGSSQKRPPLQQPQRPSKRYWGHHKRAGSCARFDNPRSSTQRLSQQPLSASSSPAADENSRWSWNANAAPPMSTSTGSAGSRNGSCRLTPVATGATGLQRCGLCGELIDARARQLQLRKCNHLVHASCFSNHRFSEMVCLTCADPTFKHLQHHSRPSRSTGASGNNAGSSSKWYGRRLSRSSRSRSRSGRNKRSRSRRSSSSDSDSSSSPCSRSRRRRSRVPRRCRGRRRRKKKRRRARKDSGHGATRNKCEACGADVTGWVQPGKPCWCAKHDHQRCRLAAVKRPTGSDIVVSHDLEKAEVARNSAMSNSSGAGDEEPDGGAPSNQEGDGLEVDEEGVRVAMDRLKELKEANPDDAVPVLEMLLRARLSWEVITENDWESRLQEYASSAAGRVSELATEVCESWRAIRDELHPRSGEKAKSTASADEVSESRRVDDMVAAAADVPDMLTPGETEAQAAQENAEAAAAAKNEISDISDPSSSQEQRRSADHFRAQPKATRKSFLGKCLEKARKRMDQQGAQALVNESAVEQVTPAAGDDEDRSGYTPSAISKSKGSLHLAVSKAPTTAAFRNPGGWSEPSWVASHAPAPPLWNPHGPPLVSLPAPWQPLERPPGDFRGWHERPPAPLVSPIGSQWTAPSIPCPRPRAQHYM